MKRVIIIIDIETQTRRVSIKSPQIDMLTHYPSKLSSMMKVHNVLKKPHF